MSIMVIRHLRQDGAINRLALVCIILAVLVFVALAFDIKFYSSAQNYKNQDQSMIAAAVAKEKTIEVNSLTKQFNQQQNNPFNTYVGPAIYGLFKVSYPKTWSAYVDSTGGSGNPLDGYFDPGIVPAVESSSSIFALRVQVNSGPYSSQLQQYTSSQQNGNFTIQPFSLKKVPSVVGSIIEGEIATNMQGILVLLPLRTETLEFWTEAPQYESTFLNQILPSISFQP